MTSTNKPRRVALCLILFFTALGITLANATTENNYKNETNLLPRISESTHTENGYKANIAINPHTTGIYAKENGYKTELTINPKGIGGKLTENNYQLDLIPEKTFSDTILNIPPTASNLAITPTSPRTTDDLHASYTYIDADGDPQSGTEIRWYKNGALQSAYNDQTTIPSSATTKGDQWHFKVRPKDGTFFGNLQTSPLVTIENSPPTADANGPYTGYEGSPITFNASGSTDPDGNGLQYRWDFNNDSTWDTPYSTDPTASYTWGDDYSGTVVVEAYDGTLTDTDTATVTVNNVAPTVNAGPDQTANEGSVLSFSGAFSDPGTGDTHTYFWDFGDGTNTTGTLTPTHTYGDNGIYTVTLKVTDDDGGLGIDTLQVTVNNVPPTVDAGPNQTVRIGCVIIFSGNFTDLGWLDTHTIFWDFGDGTNTTGTLTPTHVYGNTGNYTVTLKITDDDDGVGMGTSEITVNPSPPVGGIWIPVNKLSLLAPWIALATTILLAIAITATILKYRKEQ